MQIFACDNKYCKEDDNKCRVDTFDSSDVEVSNRERTFDRLLDDDTGDEVARYNEENINADESSGHEGRPCMVENNNTEGDSSEAIDIRTV